MKPKTGNIILIAMIAGVVLGALGGYYFGDILLKIKFLGTIFINALKMVVIPLIVASMIVGVASLGDIRKLGKTAGKTLLYFLSTTCIAVILGLILVNILRPGVGVPMFGGYVPDLVQVSSQKTIIDVIVSLIPENIFSAAVSGQVLPLIVISLLFGGVLTTLGVKGRPVLNFFEGLNAAIMKIVTLVLYFAPIGVLALIGGIVAENRGSIEELISGLGMYTLTVIIGLAIHGIIILPLILKLFTGRNPLTYFVNMGQALATAFSTASSSATLPVTINAAVEKNNVNPKAASFVLPLGATINMDGTALYEAVAAMFIAQIYGIPLTIGDQFIIFSMATLVSIGAAGIPHAGTVLMVFVLTAVGLPLEGIGLIWAIDWFLDRCRTTVNVWGDSIGSAIISDTAEMKEDGRIVRAAVSPRTDSREQVRPERPFTKYERKDRPSSRQGSGDSRKRYDSRDDRRPRSGPGRGDRPDRSDRPERSERPERSDRSDRPERSDRSDRHGRPDGRSRRYPPRQEVVQEQKTPVPSDEQSSRNIKEIIGPDLKVKVNHEPVRPSKSTVERELEKVRQQLDKMDGRDAGVVAAKPPLEEKKSDDYFDIDVSKLNLLGDDHPPEADTKQPLPEVANEPAETGTETVDIPDENKAPAEAQPDESADTESSSDGMWGRDKKKKLFK